MLMGIVNYTLYNRSSTFPLSMEDGKLLSHACPFQPWILSTYKIHGRSSGHGTKEISSLSPTAGVLCFLLILSFQKLGWIRRRKPSLFSIWSMRYMHGRVLSMFMSVFKILTMIRARCFGADFPSSFYLIVVPRFQLG